MHASSLPARHFTHRIEAVAIGASAGGVQAVGALLESLPQDFGAAVLVVIHLPPGTRSTLTSVFGFRCKLAIEEAEDKESIAPGRVYIAPADYHMLVEQERTLSLSGDLPVNYSRPSIDVLFESAALAYRDRLLGIILTGANGDGAEGLTCVRACGGLAWVQDPKSALADAMPAAAIARAGADLVLPLPGLVQRLEELARDMRRS